MSHEISLENCLYVVATPIGNLEDISLRAIRILRDCSLIAAEDTRHTARLLQHLGISKALVSFHDHSGSSQVNHLLGKLQAGASIALVSDAGTPAVADPGFELIRAARESGIKVIPVPGASAVIAAVSVSGLPTDRFVFEGFLPAKQAARIRHLKGLAEESRTMVFFETPHRIIDGLLDLITVFGGDRRLFVGRELTKKFETGYTDSLDNCLHRVQSSPQEQLGEFVLVLEGCAPARLAAARLARGLEILEALPSAMPLKQAVGLAASLSGAPRNNLYTAALARRQNP